MPTKNNKYSTAFSAGSLLLREAEVIVDHINDPQAFMVGEEDVDYHHLPVNSEASKKRYRNEVTKRLRSMKDAMFIDLFRAGSKSDRLLILFYATCKHYQLITDFMLESVLKKWYNLDYEITADDFKNFLYRQMDKHEELEDLAPNTIYKLSSVVIKILSDLGVLKNGKLQKREHNPTILKHIAKNGDTWFLEALLLNEAERNEILLQ